MIRFACVGRSDKVLGMRRRKFVRGLKSRRLIAGAVVLLFVQWAGDVHSAGVLPVPTIPPEIGAALASITTNDRLKHTRILSSDEFEGRAPGSPGEERT